MRKILPILLVLSAGGLAWYFYRNKKMPLALTNNPITSAIQSGTTVVKQMTNPGIRNNNPINIKWTIQSRNNPWIGQTGESGKYLVFKHPIYGFRAGARNLRSYAAAGVNTIAGIITKWAPPEDNNPTQKYIDFVSKNSGILAFTPISQKDYANILHKMALFETGKDYGIALAQEGVAKIDSTS